MTIYNHIKNISDDYTFVLNTDELFYSKAEIPCGVFEYDTSNQTWIETSKSSEAFDTKYENAKNFVKTYYQSILDIINPEAKYSDLLTEVGAGNGLFIGIQMDSIEGFPHFNDNQYFIAIISPSLKMCIPVKSFVLYSNTRIIENNDEELNDLEYLSAKQCLNLIYNAISKVEILQIVDELPTQPSDIKTNCVYLLYEENNQSQDEIDDGLNFHFTLWVYSTTDEEFKQIDRLTFDIKNYALKNHTHGLISNDGKMVINKATVTGTVINSGSLKIKGGTFYKKGVEHSYNTGTTDHTTLFLLGGTTIIEGGTFTNKYNSVIDLNISRGSPNDYPKLTIKGGTIKTSCPYCTPIVSTSDIKDKIRISINWSKVFPGKTKEEVIKYF